MARRRIEAELKAVRILQKLIWIPATGSGAGVGPQPVCSVEDFVGTNMAPSMKQNRQLIRLEEINEPLSPSGSILPPLVNRAAGRT
jgi:hypothetical protein